MSDSLDKMTPYSMTPLVNTFTPAHKLYLEDSLLGSIEALMMGGLNKGKKCMQSENGPCFHNFSRNAICIVW